MSEAVTMTPQDVLQETFGFPEFRPGQAAVVEALMAGRSALAVFPTGGGKSLCYQLPGVLLPGLTLVVSPLIALMKDQVDALRAWGVAAARLDSTLEREEVGEIYRGMQEGSLKILYVAPERLANEGFLSRLRRTKISLLAIDEAHCISEWGHNFRPDYLKIAAFTRTQGVERVLALTATATPSVSEDIREAFEITPEDHIQTGFHRPNLELHVSPTPSRGRDEALLSCLRKGPQGPSIVYVTLQRTAMEVAELLSREGYSARAYHAGLKDEVRAEVQDAFMADRVRIVVATIAFGMGIDKPDIRRIVHYNLPKSLENYVQEIGRAGRDGEASRCDLLACADDRRVLENFSYGDTPTPEALAGLQEELLGQVAGVGERFSISRYQVSARHDIRTLVVATALTYLELDGVLESTGPFYTGYKLKQLRPQREILARFDPGRQDFLRSVFDAGKRGRTWITLEPAEAAEALGQPRERIVAAVEFLSDQGEVELRPSGLRHGYQLVSEPDHAALREKLRQLFVVREERDIERIERVVAYAGNAACLTAHLLSYFGEELEACGHCGPCLGAEPAPLPVSDPVPLGEDEANLIRGLAGEGREALAHPRQLTRFLVGLKSPALTRAKLSRDPRYGCFRHVAFPRLLSLVEEVLG
jgi:ATP-dependent DNA helicase RecQ